MFVLSRNVSAGYKVIATLLTAALVVWFFGTHYFAHAANVTSVSDTLSDSDLSAVSNHTIQFTTPTGVAAGETIAITFPAGFNLSTIVFGDVDFAINGTDQTLAASPSGATWGAAAAGQTLTLTSGSGTLAPNATATIKIGTNATFGTTGTHQITNPGTTGSYQIDIAGTMADSGHTRVAILPTVQVTAQVDTTFDFNVYGTGTTTAVNGTTTTGYTSSTSIPFKKLTADQIKTLSQQLTVATNAIHGFVVTVQEDQHLLSSTGADIDNFVDGVTSATPVAWAAPTNNINDENTWGHWGLTSEDTTTTRTNQFSSDTWVGVSTTPQVIFSHTGPADGHTPGVGSTTIGYQAEITPLQEAGDDYTTTLTYIATPTF